MTAETRTVALCGAGMISSAHALAARYLGLPVIAVASRDHNKASTKANEFGATAVDYGSLPAGADVVIVSTPPGQHLEHTVHALERGAAVLVEKPLVRTLDEADRLVDLVARVDGRVLYAENLAHAPIIGEFLRTVSRITSRGESLGHLEARTIQPLPTWGGFTTVEWGGGALFDLGVHPLALVVLVARVGGAGEVTAVSCRLDGDVTDEEASVRLRFESGLIGSVTSSWRGDDTPVWDLQTSTASSVVRAELMPQLALEHNGDVVPLPDSSPKDSVPFIERYGYLGQLRTLVDSDGDFEMSVEFGRWILEIVCASYSSASRDGEWTPVPSGCDRLATPLELWRRDIGRAAP